MFAKSSISFTASLRALDALSRSEAILRIIPLAFPGSFSIFAELGKALYDF